MLHIFAFGTYHLITSHIPSFSVCSEVGKELDAWERWGLEQTESFCSVERRQPLLEASITDLPIVELRFKAI